MEQSRSRPIHCLVLHPSTQSVCFAGAYINLTKLSKVTGIWVSDLSRIFSGKRYPNLHKAKRMADALGMCLDDLVLELDAIVSDSKVA